MPFLPETYTCYTIDSNWRNVAFAMTSLFTTKSNREIQEALEKSLGGPDNYLISMSVRSAFLVLLEALRAPVGSEIIMTAVNIQHMADIAKSLGFIIKTVDIQLDTLEPDYEHLESLITERTVLVVAAQLYGRRYSLDSLMHIAHLYGLLVLEDCAQCYSGPESLHLRAGDISMFSFGPIKNSTAFGGAISVIRNPILCAKMRNVQKKYPRQTSWSFYSRVIRCSFAMTFANSPFLLWLLLKLLKLYGFGTAEVGIPWLRSFTGNLIASIRCQPCLPLLSLLQKRLLEFSADSRDKCVQKCDHVKDRLLLDKAYVPGILTDVEQHWLFPLVVCDPDAIFKELIRSGIEITAGPTQLTLITDTEMINESSNDDTERKMNWRENYDEPLASSMTHEPTASVSMRQGPFCRQNVRIPVTPSEHEFPAEDKVNFSQLDSQDVEREWNEDKILDNEMAKQFRTCLPQLQLRQNSARIIDHDEVNHVKGDSVISNGVSPNHVHMDHELSCKSPGVTENDSIYKVYLDSSGRSNSEHGQAGDTVSELIGLDPKNEAAPNSNNTSGCTNCMCADSAKVEESRFRCCRYIDKEIKSTENQIQSNSVQNGPDTTLDPLQKAKFLLKHIIYLPVHKNCSKKYLEKLVRITNNALAGRESVYDVAKRKGVILKSKL